MLTECPHKLSPLPAPLPALFRLLILLGRLNDADALALGLRARAPMMKRRGIKRAEFVA